MNKKGFSLVELIIIIIILGILASLFITNFRSSKTQAQAKQLFTDMEALMAAEKQYKLEHGEFIACEQPQPSGCATAVTCNNLFGFNIATPNGITFSFYAQNETPSGPSTYGNLSAYINFSGNCTYSYTDDIGKPVLDTADNPSCPLP